MKTPAGHHLAVHDLSLLGMGYSPLILPACSPVAIGDSLPDWLLIGIPVQQAAPYRQPQNPQVKPGIPMGNVIQVVLETFA